MSIHDTFLEQRKTLIEVEFQQQTKSELDLWAAVMHLAISDAMPKTYKRKPSREILAEDEHACRTAKNWIESDRLDIFNSFLSLCDLLDINPKAVLDLIE